MKGAGKGMARRLRRRFRHDARGVEDFTTDIPAFLLVLLGISGFLVTAGNAWSLVATDDAEDELTAGLGWAASTRALGSAAAVGAAPALIAIGGVGAVSALAGAVLATMALAGLMRAALVAELPRVSRPVRAEATGEGRR